MSGDYNPDSVDAVLARIETKLDAVIRRQDAGDLQRASILERIESLEKWKWTVLGGAAGVSALMKIILDYIHK